MAENTQAQDALGYDEKQSPTQPLSGRSMVAAARREVRIADRAARRTAPEAGRRRSPLRAAGSVAALCALIAGVAIPAYAATTGGESPRVGVHEQAEGEAQTYEAGAEAALPNLASIDYAATSADEIAQKKAEEEALSRAKAQQEAAESVVSDSGSGAPASVPDAPPATVVDGGICPLPGGSYFVSRSVGSGHEGTDMVAPAMTPIYAVKSGTVTVSSESHGGWGVTVAIDHGDGTQTLYGHMTYGTRQVAAGQAVEAGQVIGYVGSTGRSTANHLHIELRVNGVIVDPMAYLPI